MKKSVLDNSEEINRYDRHGMLGVIEAFPEQCIAAKTIGEAISVPGSFRSGYKNVVCAGLGGSAIGADILRSCFFDEVDVPIFVSRDYIMPGFVGKDTLVVASSYSGNTEETLSAYKDAKRKKAKVIAITSGGKLRRMCLSDRTPVIIIPDGLQPRSALGYSFFPLVYLLINTGVLKVKSGQVDETIMVLRNLRDRRIGQEVGERVNIAKKIARRLYGKFPVLYGAQCHVDSIVTRWRSQFAENSKTLSSSHFFPEMNHNEIVGWENPVGVLKCCAPVILRDCGDHPRVAKRMDITKKLLAASKYDVMQVHSVGKGLLARMFSLAYIGDFVSFYLAIINKTDPTPVDRIVFLKKELAGT